MQETVGRLLDRVQQDDAEPPLLLPAWAHGRFRGDLGGHKHSAPAALRSTAARSPSSGQATNRRVEDGRVRRGENQCSFFF